MKEKSSAGRKLSRVKRKYDDQSSEAVVSILKDLMAFKTTQDNPGEIRKCAGYIVRYLRDRGLAVKRFSNNGKVSIIAGFRESKKYQLILNAHFDVVPAPDRLYRPRIKNGRVYGRGSDDCKAQIAVLMHLMEILSRKESKPDVALMLTGDEEVGGHDGVRYLLEEEGYKCDFAIVADGGEDWEVITRHKGVLHLKLSASGRTAHASEYWNGENAAEKLVLAYPQVQKIFPKLKGSAWKTTANLSRISGGHTMNQVPDYAEMFLDVRLVDTDSEGEILKKLRKVKGIKAEKVFSSHGHLADSGCSYLSELRKSIEKVLKRKSRTGYANGATDARYFSKKGMNAVIFKPLGRHPHSDGEYTEISSIGPYISILQDFVERSIRHF